MPSNYKRLGEYIREVNIRNRKLEAYHLIGLSIQKEFIPSIANTIGTDMSTYRVIKRSQFAYCPVTSRNGEKITVALFDKFDEAIISQAYTVFEIIDTEILSPEYLMMWFRRPEFDRYARFQSHGSVREMFDWNEMCEVELPIPSIDKQKEIVAEYNIIQNRITLNNQLIQKLEETAQTIYKQWFMDNIDKENLPEGWTVEKLGKIVNSTLGGDWGKDSIIANYDQEVLCVRGTDIPIASNGQAGNMPIRFIIKKNLQNRQLNNFDIVIEISGGSPTQSTGRSLFVTEEYLKYMKKNVICSNFCRVIKSENNYPEYLYHTIKYLYRAGVLFTYENSSNGVKNLALDDLFREEKIVVPSDKIICKFKNIITPINKCKITIGREIDILYRLKELVLAKMAKF
ncbi:MAG: hypothetical protein EZS26_001504 [Candidatus Ordinivivax streblomastigis]|uniref:Type I restriction modification DNA specificity domain-containing protein n=1 Tax=Candidatus Ordinivivax streblomastigis TaxID=2540710 RepID=A0A5M8P1U0_9BACT|nr:MAG: hypothetical protein EZS26_001504 [Candidatus Ordinivivax streblomastigis]